MELFIKPGACSLAAHIALLETGEAFDLVPVDTAAGRTTTGEDYRLVNPEGYVPALRLDDGRVLAESAAVLQFIAELHPEAGLAPEAGTFERAKLQEHLNFTASELHKAFKPFFSGAPLAAEPRSSAAAAVVARLEHFERLLEDGRPYLLGERFSVADAYLFVVAGWTGHVGIALDALPRLQAFIARVAARDHTRAALRAEGLTQ